MYRFIETIKIENGILCNLEYHQDRVNRTYRNFKGTKEAPELLQIIEIPDRYRTGKARCRLIYDLADYEVEFHLPRDFRINSLKVVESGPIDYNFKYEDRSSLLELFKKRGEADDILIVIDQMLTDSYYCNLAFFDGSDWYTPERPLLAGTRRHYLLETGKLKKLDIRVSDLADFEKVSMINAMLDLGEMEVPTKLIHF